MAEGLFDKLYDDYSKEQKDKLSPLELANLNNSENRRTVREKVKSQLISHIAYLKECISKKESDLLDSRKRFIRDDGDGRRENVYPNYSSKILSEIADINDSIRAVELELVELFGDHVE